VRLRATADLRERKVQVQGEGTGPIDAFINGLNAQLDSSVRVLDYHEHSIASGADAKAVAYLELRIGDAMTVFGVGIDANIVSASLKAIASGLHRATQRGHVRFADPVTA